MKTTLIRRLISVFAVAACSLLGLAQVQADERDDGWTPVKHLSFDEDDIEGDTLSPLGERIDSLRAAQQESLIEIRQGFEDEVAKSMEDM
jgi:hypothetical protein